MSNLIFSLNATMPVFLLMVLGYGLHRLGLFDDVFAAKANAFVFRVALPAKLFADMAGANLSELWDTRFVVYCFAVSAASVALGLLLSRLCRDRLIRGEFTQVTYRSSSAIMGIAYMQNIYGSSGMTPLMIAASVPLYNVAAVVLLTLTGPAAAGRKPDIKKTLIDIAKNPIILGILAGLLWSLTGITMPSIPEKLISNVGSMASPLGLMSMGAMFTFSAMLREAKPVLAASFLKLIGFAALFLPIAVWMGFTGSALVSILILLASPATISSFIMAKNMGHDGTVTSGTVMLTTLLSALTMTGWLFLLKSFGLI